MYLECHHILESLVVPNITNKFSSTLTIGGVVADWVSVHYFIIPKKLYNTAYEVHWS